MEGVGLKLHTKPHNTEDFILKMLNQHVKYIVIFSGCVVFYNLLNWPKIRALHISVCSGMERQMRCIILTLYFFHISHSLLMHALQMLNIMASKIREFFTNTHKHTHRICFELYLPKHIFTEAKL